MKEQGIDFSSPYVDQQFAPENGARKLTYSNLFVASKIENDVDGPAVRFSSASGKEMDKSKLPFDELVSQIIALLDERAEDLPFKSTIGSETLQFSISSLDDVKDILEDLIVSDAQNAWEGKSAVFPSITALHSQLYEKKYKAYKRKERWGNIFKSAHDQKKTQGPTMKDHLHKELEGKDRTYVRQFALGLFWDSLSPELYDAYQKTSAADFLESHRFVVNLSSGKTFALEEEEGIVLVEKGYSFKGVQKISIAAGGNYQVRKRKHLMDEKRNLPDESNELTTVWDTNSPKIPLVKLRENVRGLAKQSGGVVCKQSGVNLVIDNEENNANSMTIIETRSDYGFSNVEVYFIQPNVGNVELVGLDGKTFFTTIAGNLNLQSVMGEVVGENVSGNISAVGVRKLRIKQKAYKNVNLVSSEGHFHEVVGDVRAVKSKGKYYKVRGQLVKIESNDFRMSYDV